MCCIASKPAGHIIPKKYLKNMWMHNPHGLGFAFAKDGTIYLEKGFRSFKNFWRMFRDYQEYPAIIHMRWANRGKVSAENDHPFVIDSGLVFAHNGTVSIDLEGDHSDTRMFCEKVLKPLRERDEDFLSKPFNRWLLAKSIAHSKLAFLSKDGKLDIINKSFGEEEDGIWYSNSDYKNFSFVKKAIGFNQKSNNFQQQNFRNGFQDPDCMSEDDWVRQYTGVC